MSEKEEPVAGSQRLTELFSALRGVVAENPRLQALIREQEQDNRQVLLNMSSVLRMVEQGDAGELDGGAELYQPRAIRGWIGGDEGIELEGNTTPAADVAEPQAIEPQVSNMPALSALSDDVPSMNFFDRAFLKSLKISL